MTLKRQDNSPASLSFRPTARLLQLLGDELIASPRLAVFEMVKNAYDADASKVFVTFDIDNYQEPSITVTDDGSGMTLETIQHIWMVPGNNHRQKQREERHRTPIHNRLPVGEKGIGRFAAHKLGDRIQVITKSQNDEEYEVDIDWSDLIQHQFLEEAKVDVVGRSPILFTEGNTGTAIKVTNLRQQWGRGEVRRLHQQILSLCSPYESSESFHVAFTILGHEDWVRDLPQIEDIINRAFWKFEFELNEQTFNWKYQFRQQPGIKLEGSRSEKTGDTLRLPPSQQRDTDKEDHILRPDTLQGIGPIHGTFHVYDQDQPILRQLDMPQSITRYLKDAGGVRIYRDNIRVYNYGEPGDDWLGLDLRRVNAPTRRISNNNILGTVHLSLADSSSLVEKTNREGFQDNIQFDTLQRIIIGILETFEAQRFPDKQRLRAITDLSAPPMPSAGTMDKLVDQVTDSLRHLSGDTEPIKAHLERIRNYYSEMESTFLSASMSGLNLAVVFHEVERSVQTLHQAVIQRVEISSLEEHTKNLSETLSSFSALLRRDSQKRHSAKELVAAAWRINRFRLNYHHVNLTCPFLESDEAGFYADFTFNLTLGSLGNLIDNALYWLRVRWPDKTQEKADSPRRLYIGISHDFDAGPAIVVADNGAGFEYSSPDKLVRPFFTHKPDGMGLGLFYTSLAMELQHGQLIFPKPGETEIPEGFDGAVVGMLFKETD